MYTEYVMNSYVSKDCYSMMYIDGHDFVCFCLNKEYADATSEQIDADLPSMLESFPHRVA